MEFEPVKILLIEDNKSDVRLTVKTLKEYKVSNSIDVVNDGEEATDFLFKRGGYVNAVQPDLILLDLNLPKKDGREVLAEIKNNQELKRIPVVVLTSSEAEKDILMSYNLHANAYIVKPVDMYQFAEVIKHINDFWLFVVKLPTKL